MIKRDGVEVMNARTKNVSIAKETVEISKKKRYRSLSGKVVDIADLQNFAMENTIYYPGDSSPTFREPAPIHAQIEVTNETTAQAAVRLLADGKTDLVALNFASARNQGGGFLAGAIAQEEDLCRASGLYACLKTKPLFYNANLLQGNAYYTNGAIYTPKVPFFRNEHNLFLEEPFALSIISSPAPNVSAIEEVDDDVLIEKLLTRAIKILQIAAFHGHKNLILGAWGCGAFGNNPAFVSRVFMEALRIVPYFEFVCFAVYDNRTPAKLYETFKEVCCSVQADGS